MTRASALNVLAMTRSAELGERMHPIFAALDGVRAETRIGDLHSVNGELVAALERELPATATWSRPEGGYFLWAELGVDTAELLERATAAGVVFVKGSDFFPGGRGGETAARLAYSYVTAAEIGEGIARLADLLGRGRG